MSARRRRREPGAGVARRSFLLGALATLAGGACSPPPPALAPEGKPTPLPPLRDASLLGLLPAADLRWLVVTRPREIAEIPWLIPSIGAVVSEERFGQFQAVTAVDLRQLPEAVVASYAPDGTLFYLVRHNGDPVAIERAFRKRLTSDEQRIVDRPDLIRLSGKTAMTTSAMVLVGREVVGVQTGGSRARGPARIAALYAEDKLKKSPTALARDPLHALAAKLADAPAWAVAVGPFEGELGRGARGLLAGATAIGGAVRPSAREGLVVTITVTGDFGKSGEAAAAELLAAWNELATGAFGRIMGLAQGFEPPAAAHTPDSVTVTVELSPRKIAEGLAATTTGSLDAILR